MVLKHLITVHYMVKFNICREVIDEIFFVFYIEFNIFCKFISNNWKLII